jgi:hypothetical protein
MSDVFPGGVPLVELGIFYVIFVIGFGIDVRVSAGRGVSESMREEGMIAHFERNKFAVYY